MWTACVAWVNMLALWRASQVSRSASSSHGGGGGGHGGDYDRQGSPVPYYIWPLAYEPAVLCKCKAKACRWISWSNGHPGRKFYTCRKARTGDDYGYFLWADEEASDWFKELLRDLKDVVWFWKREATNKEGELDAKDMKL
uniref:GRF-type domain-containing protein n=1 Tax=Saccharum hybrid cultivar R570 TaxID=131158 RepID=A0A059Q0Y7_9POAL|nr:hypothetical protein SHCRBa_011_I19_R_260 [Saccharum hybrid cultivar R570]